MRKIILILFLINCFHTAYSCVLEGDTIKKEPSFKESYTVDTSRYSLGFSLFLGDGLMLTPNNNLKVFDEVLSIGLELYFDIEQKYNFNIKLLRFVLYKKKDWFINLDCGLKYYFSDYTNNLRFGLLLGFFIYLVPGVVVNYRPFKRVDFLTVELGFFYNYDSLLGRNSSLSDDINHVIFSTLTLKFNL